MSKRERPEPKVEVPFNPLSVPSEYTHPDHFNGAQRAQYGFPEKPKVVKRDPRR